MYSGHRRIIENHRQRLTEITDYDEMKQLFLKKGVFTAVMFENIEQDYADDVERLHKMYEKLTHRGPDAFQTVVDIFREEKNEEALKLLTNSTVSAQSYTCPVVVEDNRFLSLQKTNILNRQNSNNISNNNVIVPDEKNRENATDGINMSKNKEKLKLKPYEENTSFHFDQEVKKAENFGTHRFLNVYPMKSRKRGVFFFVNIINFDINPETKRNGAQRDRDNLVTLFRELNFTIFYYEDLTKVQLLDLLDQLTKSTYLKNIDSFFLCIQTHGDLVNNQTIMEFKDGSRETTENIISMFSNIECQALVGKPKVFIFPFCRGKISDRLRNVYVPIETDGKPFSEMSQISVPKFSDILICYGTVPGFMTHRDIEFGSWYVREMCKAFAKHACDCHVEELLKLVGANTMGYRETEGRTQVASVEGRGFNNLLFLNPKIYE